MVHATPPGAPRISATDPMHCPVRISRFTADSRLSLEGMLSHDRRMDSDDEFLEAARITIAREIRSRFAPGPERDRWLVWLAPLDPPRPESMRPIARRRPGLH